MPGVRDFDMQNSARVVAAIRVPMPRREPHGRRKLSVGDLTSVLFAITHRGQALTLPSIDCQLPIASQKKKARLALVRLTAAPVVPPSILSVA